MMRNVNTSRPMPNGISSWRITYRSIIFIRGRFDYDPRRVAVAHAPALLSGPGDRRAHPAVGAPPRTEGLLGHGGAAARVPGREGDLQPRTVHAGAARSLCPGRRSRSPSGAGAEARRRPDRRRAGVLRGAFLTRASRPDDRSVSAVCGAAGAPG